MWQYAAFESDSCHIQLLNNVVKFYASWLSKKIWWENFNKVNLNTLGVFSSDLFLRIQACSFFSVFINEWSILNKLNKPELQRGVVDSRFVSRHTFSAFTTCPPLFEKIVTLCPPSRNVRYCMKKSSQFVRASRKASFFRK